MIKDLIQLETMMWLDVREMPSISLEDPISFGGRGSGQPKGESSAVRRYVDSFSAISPCTAVPSVRVLLEVSCMEMSCYTLKRIHCRIAPAGTRTMSRRIFVHLVNETSDSVVLTSKRLNYGKDCILSSKSTLTHL